MRVSTRVCDEGNIILATNIESYANEAHSQAVNVWELQASLSKVPSTSERTHFEVKYLARGETCWQLDIKKPQGYVTRFDETNFL